MFDSFTYTAEDFSIEIELLAMNCKMNLLLEAELDEIDDGSFHHV